MFEEFFFVAMGIVIISFVTEYLRRILELQNLIERINRDYF